MLCEAVLRRHGLDRQSRFRYCICPSFGMGIENPTKIPVLMDLDWSRVCLAASGVVVNTKVLSPIYALPRSEAPREVRLNFCEPFS